MLERFKDLLYSNANKLDGNYNPHSLKTYLLAYANYLAGGDIGYKGHAMSPVEFYHKMEFVNKPGNIERRYYLAFEADELRERAQL
jgi:hypothetical protein